MFNMFATGMKMKIFLFAVTFAIAASLGAWYYQEQAVLLFNAYVAVTLGFICEEPTTLDKLKGMFGMVTQPRCLSPFDTMAKKLSTITSGFTFYETDSSFGFYSNCSLVPVAIFSLLTLVSFAIKASGITTSVTANENGIFIFRLWSKRSVKITLSTPELIAVLSAQIPGRYFNLDGLTTEHRKDLFSDLPITLLSVRREKPDPTAKAYFGRLATWVKKPTIANDWETAMGLYLSRDQNQAFWLKDSKFYPTCVASTHSGIQRAMSNLNMIVQNLLPEQSSLSGLEAEIVVTQFDLSTEGLLDNLPTRLDAVHERVDDDVHVFKKSDISSHDANDWFTAVVEGLTERSEE